MPQEKETISVEGPIDLYEGIVTAPPAFVVVYGANLGKAYYLQQPEQIVGRSLTCDIQLDEDSVSRAHARIAVEHQVTTVCDLDSTNGVFVNGHRVQRATLKDGDRLHLGETVLKYLSSTNTESKFHEDIYRLMTVDELRRNIEALGADAYDKLSYYERWMHSIAQTLIQRGVVSIDELGRKMTEVEAREHGGRHE